MFILLGFTITIIVIVFFHELGHFLVARLFGVKIDVFSVGMGPKLISRVDRYGTQWQLSALPLGGYVRMLEGEGTKNTNGSFESKTVLQRILIVLAGPLASLLLGWILYFAVYNFYGSPIEPDYRTQGIGEVVAGGSAFEIGLKSGDVITSVESNSKVSKVENFYDLYVAIQNAKTNKMVIKYTRDGIEKTSEIKSRAVILDGEKAKIVYRIGIMSTEIKYKDNSAIEALGKASVATGKSLTLIYDGLISMLSGNANYDDVGGPIKIAQISGQAAKSGLRYLLSFIGILSINLAVLNMLPIPIMDGGRIVLLAMEGVLRKPLPKKLVAIIMSVSVWFVLGLFVLITLKDIGIF